MPEPRKLFERRYTPEQTRAIVHAMLDARPPLSAREACRRATAGTLPGCDLPPFGSEQLEDGTWKPISEQTAYTWRKRERAERGVKAHGRLAKAGSSNEALRIVLADAWNEIEKADEAARKAKPGPTERLKYARERVATARAIHEAERSLQGKRGKTEQTEPEQPARTRRDNEASALARAARERATTEQHDAPPITTDQGSASVTDQGSASEQQQHETHSVAREQAQHESANGHAITPQAVR